MKKTIFLIAFVTAILFACRKGLEFDNQYIRGRAFLEDTFSGNFKQKPAVNKRVFLSKQGDTLNFMYSTITDNEGYFRFDLLSDDNCKYTIIAYDTIVGLNFKGKVDVERGTTNAALILQPDPNGQNGVLIYAKDQQNGSIPLVTLKFYNNLLLAQAQATSGFFTVITDTLGKGYRVNLAPGDYYMNALKSIDTATYERIAKKITITDNGFIVDTMMLFRKVTQNGFVLMLKDSIGDPLLAEVKLYNSKFLAEKNAGGWIEFLSPDNTGKVSKTNIAPGTYYLNAEKVLGNDTFRRVGKVVLVPVSGVIVDTMILQRVFPTILNGFVMQARDSLGGIFPLTEFRLYNSSVLAASNSGGAIQTQNSDNYGVVSFYNLPGGTYYLNARKGIDTLIFERLVKPIFLNATILPIDTMVLRRKL